MTRIPDGQPELANAQKAPWWRTGVIYQIYPRSFQDSNRDGIGDLNGIAQRLDYVASLGVDAIWLSPFFRSPMKDFGYDISDFEDVEPMFGTLEDFDQLLAESHRRGLKVVLDFVPNHTSDLHPWFQESRRSKQSEKRDWYVWSDPKPGGGPPNRWQSEFGGSAWELDKETGQYYFHAFLKEQPDLNWRNEEVVKAMLATLRFWLDRGVDGFRVDAISHLFEDPELRENPEGSTIYTRDLEETHEAVRKMRKVVDEYPGRVLIVETYLPSEKLVAYYGKDDEASFPFNFQLIFAPWKAKEIDALIRGYEGALGPGHWPNWVTGNHDRSRIVSRIGEPQARVAALLLLTLRGTPTLYYGEELGMSDVPVPPELVQDPFERNVPGKGNGRDPERSPMVWDDGPQAGFTGGRPWLPLSADYQTRNVASVSRDPHSMLSLYRALLAERRERRALTLGKWVPWSSEDDVLCYERRLGDQRLLVVLNFSHRPKTVANPAAKGTVALSTFLDRKETIDGKLSLRANEGVLIALD